MGKGYRLGRYRAIKPYSNVCDVPVTALARDTLAVEMFLIFGVSFGSTANTQA